MLLLSSASCLQLPPRRRYVPAGTLARRLYEKLTSERTAAPLLGCGDSGRLQQIEINRWVPLTR